MPPNIVRQRKCVCWPISGRGQTSGTVAPCPRSMSACRSKPTICSELRRFFIREPFQAPVEARRCSRKTWVKMRGRGHCHGSWAVLDEQGRNVVDRWAFVVGGHRRFLLGGGGTSKKTSMAHLLISRVRTTISGTPLRDCGARRGELLHALSLGRPHRRAGAEGLLSHRRGAGPGDHAAASRAPSGRPAKLTLGR